jgi:D-alanyl-D-alanine carboxypeptidase (penicillin-binding protein 5/6)
VPQELAAKAVVLMDVATGTVLYEQNAHEKLPPASVTKVMTMLLVMEAIDSGRLSWEDTVTASAEAAAKGGSQVYLKEGETMAVSDMVKSIAVSSANDCACAMAEHLAGSEAAFVDTMNQRARELGMTDTHFVNCTGLDDGPNASEHLTSARDIAIMSQELLSNHPDIKKYTTIWMDTIRGGAFGLTNTNRLVRFYRGATGLKTGSTSKAGFCVSVTAERDGLSLICVIMGAESRDVRNAQATRLLDWGFANYAAYRAEPKALEDVHILGGVKNNCAVEYEPFSAVLPKGDISRVEQKTEMNEQAAAPIRVGDNLGQVQYLLDGKVIGEVPITAQEDIEKIGFWGLFLRMLAKIFMM